LFLKDASSLLGLLPSVGSLFMVLLTSVDDKTLKKLERTHALSLVVRPTMT
jgi:hypothetical protein